MTKPLVSVVLPVYNAERYLREALDSLLNQTFDDLEILAVNDGSKDSSLDILHHYAAVDDRIIVIDQENKGLVTTLNETIPKARGTYIARMDADDISLPRRLQLQVEQFEENPNLALVTGCYEVINEFSEFVRFSVLPTNDSDIKRSLHLYNPIAHGSVMFRKETFLKTGGYRSDVGPTEDYELWLRMAHEGEFYALPHSIFRWRINLDGITHTNNDEMVKWTRKHVEDMWRLYPPAIAGPRQLRQTFKTYVHLYKKRGIRMKMVILDDNCRIGVKMIARKQVVKGVRQILSVAATGRPGIKVVINRIVYTAKILLKN